MSWNFLAGDKSHDRLYFLWSWLWTGSPFSLQTIRYAALSIVFVTLSTYAAAPSANNLANLSFEELADIRITSVSKKEERLADAPASVTVITNEDIRRSGATSLPEALRLAPNLQVARVDARNYAITARGFNSPFENKLLVLIDGRTVYSPLFSGVFWDAQDVMLEDVERIEVISGPGGTLWGANAVNGVINIITRSAADTQGGLVSAGASHHEKNGAIRYGGKLENDFNYRVYGKYADNDDTKTASGQSTQTGWHRDQTGFRMDRNDRNNQVTMQGDAYDGALNQAGTSNIQIAGANLLGRVDHKMEDGSSLRFQTYIDHTERNQPQAFNEYLDTIDVELQHTLQLATMHNVVWGTGYRLAVDHVSVNSGSTFAFLPGSENLHWANIFAQDEIDLSKTVRLTAGTKVESNGYTGHEFLPNISLSWKPVPDHLLWTSASRAVRTPSRIDRDLYSPANAIIINGTPHYVIGGGPDYESEVAKVYEVGYRGQLASALTYSITGFYSVYDNLRTLEPNPNGFGFLFMNKAEGRSRGVEMSSTWQATHAWRLTSGLVSQRLDTHLKAGSADISGSTGLANNDPHSYWMLRSTYDISEDKELDIVVRHVGRLPNPDVPAYTSMDLRFGWKIRRNLALSLIGQNLAGPSHPEFGAAPNRSEYDRSLFTKLVWTY
ncbi:MAG TPA: TonB-dependent receptor [Burkholderiaceae bacterium]|jgi:iron complex outermembrane receptor protein